jgi:hypothetical protein
MFGFLTSGLGSILTAMLGSAQIASLGRKIGLAIAVALLSKYNIADPSHLLEVVSAGAAGLWSIVSSIKAHMADTKQTAADAVKEAATIAAQTAIASALPSIMAQLASAGTWAPQPVTANG